MVENDWFKVKEIAEKVWAIDENIPMASYNSYLVEGEEKALLIDTGWGIGNLAELVQSITPLPVTVVFTHGDFDHVCGAFQFSDLYISNEDKNLLTMAYNKEARKQIIENHHHLKNKPYPVGFSKEKWINAEINDVSTVQEGDTFDLGGRNLKVLAVPGHTPGSICLLDEKNKLLFSGDSIQTFVGVRTETPLSTYLNSLLHIYSLEKDYNKILSAHSETPLTKSVLEELVNGVSDIVEGKLVGKPEQKKFGDFVIEGLACEFNTTSIMYDMKYGGNLG